MKLLYFAQIREDIGQTEEEWTMPDTVTDVAGLMDALGRRGPHFTQAFADKGRVRAAVNQQHVAFDHPVDDGDEVAFFPPMTGG